MRARTQAMHDRAAWKLLAGARHRSPNTASTCQAAPQKSFGSLSPPSHPATTKQPPEQKAGAGGQPATRLTTNRRRFA